ncbi:MAG: MerR family transcriptional regulator [Proteobacteria bacterium]|nr:MerR family transcriptional regulator [Pseudomonadota bacterium]MBU1419829.1 MerR family transcriptional regulator [Pseudomonadota bacterium]MBU1454648.1 MerR family transcriptional regulator [Pseudomonadota bacterium]
MRAEIPDKLYFKIGEVSKLAGVAPHVLRYWESEFKEIRPKRANSKQRLYRREDVELILLIKQLLHEKGYTISGARKFLAGNNEKKVPAAESPTALGCLDKIKQELLQMKRLLEKKE